MKKTQREEEERERAKKGKSIEICAASRIKSHGV